MGLCCSSEKEASKISPRSQGRRLGTSDKQQTIKSGPYTHKKPHSNVTQIKGRRLGSAGDGSNAGGSISAKDMAAQAASQRLADRKKKDEKGTLGKKLAEQNKKDAKQMALDEYNQKKNSQPQLVYD